MFQFTEVNDIELFLLLDAIDSKKSLGHNKVHTLLLSPGAFEIFRACLHGERVTLLRRSPFYKG